MTKYNDEVKRVALSAKEKGEFVHRNAGKYFVLSALAGFFVIVGLALSCSTAGIIDVEGKLYGKIAVGLTFPISLALLHFAGGELFTGNCFILTIGLLQRSISWTRTLSLLLVSYMGNLAGSVLLAYLYVESGAPLGRTAHFILKTVESKLAIPADDLLLKGILCNFVVCLAVWVFYKMKEETAQLFMLLYCVFAFTTSGLEHSIANMGLFAIALLLPHSGGIPLLQVVQNMGWVTLGNMIGGSLFLAVPYWYVSLAKVGAG
ncbi:formate/nitrite transporter family protein [Gorillibacterium sp. CAU 1737]|uniref:formate/nitrite transporter family protein n=1 Tax=Gorillibacterium sp. CAU 1737 TaxID=3140362 RepID=UPI00326007C8